MWVISIRIFENKFYYKKGETQYEVNIPTFSCTCEYTVFINKWKGKQTKGNWCICCENEEEIELINEYEGGENDLEIEGVMKKSHYLCVKITSKWYIYNQKRMKKCFNNFISDVEQLIPSPIINQQEIKSNKIIYIFSRNEEK